MSNAKPRVVKNRDNDVLEPFGLIGFVDEVNGRGAEEVEGYVPTRHELVILIKHWQQVVLDLDYWWFLCQQVGSSEVRQQSFACRRVDRIARLIGDDEANRAIKEAWDEFGKQQDPRRWDIFVNGDKAQRKALQEEMVRELYGVGEADGKSIRLGEPE